MEIIRGIPQGSMLGLLFGHLFDFCDIFLTDQFFIIKDIDIANCAYIIADNIDDLIELSEELPLLYSNGLIIIF